MMTSKEVTEYTYNLSDRIRFSLVISIIRNNKDRGTLVSLNKC